ncbi:DUF6542 domain-containing protein [Actinomadura sp. SCN-SB]|uniref:DUF6542 domain-containing protein n=1 Tax=Actinomadura sp. SCN-SB TaxID=3373092 RepID=UPI0037521237
MSSPTVREAPAGASPDAGGRVRGQRGRGGRGRGSVPARGSRGGPVTLTGRGGVVVVFAAGLAGALGAHWFGLSVLSGLGFAAGCVLAALATRKADLLTLAVSPPAVFLAATVLAELVAALGEPSLLRGVSVGVLSALAHDASWLFGGTLLVLAITLPRGLMGNVRELRGRLRGSRLFEQEENENPVRWEEPPVGRHRVAREEAE